MRCKTTSFAELSSNPLKRTGLFITLVFYLISYLTMAHFSSYPQVKTNFMKIISTCILALFTVMMVSFTEQNGIDDVIGALNSGNTSELSKYIDENIEISLPDKSDSYSKAQGILILKDFFTNNGVRSFDVKHKGDGPSGQYCVGTLFTKNGNYRTNVFMKQKGDKQVVKEIRFQTVD